MSDKNTACAVTERGKAAKAYISAMPTYELGLQLRQIERSISEIEPHVLGGEAIDNLRSVVKRLRDFTSLASKEARVSEGYILYSGSRDELSEMCRVKDAHIANLKSLLHEIDALLEMVWPHFGADDADRIRRIQERIIYAVSK